MGSTTSTPSAGASHATHWFDWQTSCGLTAAQSGVVQQSPATQASPVVVVQQTSAAFAAHASPTFAQAFVWQLPVATAHIEVAPYAPTH
jgi:hypothetical protein